MNRDIFSTSLTNAIGIVLGLLQGIIVVRAFGTSGKGEIAFFLSMYNLVFAFSNLGIKQSLAFFLGKISISKILFFQFFVVCCLVYTILLGLFLFFNNSDYDYRFLVFGLIGILTLFTSQTSSFPLNSKRINEINAIKLINTIVTFSLVALIIGLLRKTELKYFYMILLLGHLSGFVYSYFKIFKIDADKVLIEIKDTSENFWIVLKKGFQYCLPLFIYILNYKIDLIILPNFVNLSEVGIYSVGVTFAEFVWQIPTVLSLVIFSHTITSKDHDKFSKYIWNKFSKIMWLTIPVLIIYSMALKYAIPFLYGDEFSFSSLISYILLPGTYFVIGFNILNANLAGKGDPITGAVFFGIGAILNVFLNIILIPKYGITAAAATSTFTYSLSSIAFYRYYWIKNIK